MRFLLAAGQRSGGFGTAQVTLKARLAGRQGIVGSAKPRGIIRHRVIRHAPQAPTPAATGK
jgi:hypothetical protein